MNATNEDIEGYVNLIYKMVRQCYQVAEKMEDKTMMLVFSSILMS